MAWIVVHDKIADIYMYLIIIFKICFINMLKNLFFFIIFENKIDRRTDLALHLCV